MNMTEILPHSTKVANGGQMDNISAKKKTLACKVFLIGMPGAGKTYWSNILKKKLKLPVYDLDTVVEVMDDRSIPEIFSDEGEDYFRKAETKMLHLFSEKKQFILATGGGAPCYNNNMQWMNKNGVTIWINEPIEVLCNRIESEIGQRPLLNNSKDEELKKVLEEKLQERLPFYEMAAYKLCGTNITESNFVEIIKQHA